MKRDLFDKLCCPECRGSLKLKVIKGVPNEIEEGMIDCLKCKRTYKIEEGIPRMLPDRFRE